MGFFSKLGDAALKTSGLQAINDYVLGGNAKDAAEQAANIQAGSADKAIEFQRVTRDLARGDLSPYNEFGSSQINPLTALLTGQGQADYLTNNPMFSAALDSINKATMNNRAARGKLGSGGTLKALENNYMATALPYLQNQQNALFNAVNMGQSSAAGQANTAMNTGNAISNLTTQQGNALASGVVGGANARQEGVNNLFNMGMTGAALFCDERLKTDINEVDRDELGGIYEFKYIDQDETYKGRLAQELQKTRPDAVLEHESGYLMVTPEFAPERVA